ncbi:enoyl-CoA hydratase/isomerase family protein [Bradyrhizobium vignae]|uniref:enoyl-CoA hydratase/isomerase family protein n=1 Tax=Bradyrhizobium TaxID=374 RepID=UPI001FE0EBC9|nr:enoyl-CoA hydratase/isomerase family protein [Bradyrhizobium vignae]
MTSDSPVTYERAGNIARIIPAIHYAHLPRIVGRHRAFELLFTGRVFSAMEARELGVVNRVVGDAELEPEVVKLAAQFAEKIGRRAADGPGRLHAPDRSRLPAQHCKRGG